MVAYGQVQTAYRELGPMLDRILRDGAFFEWYSRDGAPMGSGDFRGSAAQIAKSVDMLEAWAASR
jgi:hypothetical protein